MTRLQRFIRCEGGATAVEFAFIGLLLFVSTIGIVEVGRALFLMNELFHAADRASRVVMLQFNIAESDLTTVVRDANLLTGLIPVDVGVVSTQVPPNANFRTVTLTYPFTPMVPALSLGAVTLTAARQVAR